MLLYKDIPPMLIKLLYHFQGHDKSYFMNSHFLQKASIKMFKNI